MIGQVQAASPGKRPLEAGSDTSTNKANFVTRGAAKKG